MSVSFGVGQKRTGTNACATQMVQGEAPHGRQAWGLAVDAHRQGGRVHSQEWLCYWRARRCRSGQAVGAAGRRQSGDKGKMEEGIKSANQGIGVPGG